MRELLAASSGLEELDPIVLETVLEPEDFVDYVRHADHLNKKKLVDGVEYRLTALPSEFMACNEFKSNDISLSEFRSALNGYEGTEYYQLQIEVPGVAAEIASVNLTSQQEYRDRISYLAFSMQNDLKVVDENGVEVPCSVYHFERTYNVTPYSTFLIGFETGPVAKSMERTVVLEDNLFNNGLIKFNWSKDQLSNIPQIKLL